ncbi:hypothetical protein N9N26_01045 [Candidatus Poseidoniales archaeon]|jgi:hypothetical protein|nr:hypothetical protein [Candidatus Poseidoniales archaeon]
MTEEQKETEPSDDNNGLSEDLVNGLSLLHNTGLRFVTVVVQPNGELTLHTAENSNRIEIVGMLEVARDAVRS